MSKPLAVIPTYVKDPRGLEATLVTLETLHETAGSEVDVLVVDDASPVPALVDEIEAATSRLQAELVRLDENNGFSTTVNVGLRRAMDESRDAILVNADIEFIEPGWVDLMREQPTWDGERLASVVGGLLLYPNYLIQHGGIFFSLLHRQFGHIYQYAPHDLPEAQRARRCPVTGALQFIRAGTLAQVGLYDEDFRMGYEDVDFCVRVFLAGGECVYQPRVRALHHESLFRGEAAPGSRLERWQHESWVHFMHKWRTQSFAEWVPSLI